MRRPAVCFLIVWVSLVANASLTRAADPMDWPMWRGPRQNNSSTEKNLVESWDPAGGRGSNLIWKNTDLGSRSTPIVMNGMLYTMVRDEAGTPIESEKVVCVDAATGEKKWEYRYNVYLSEVPNSRVAWSSVVGDPETGRVYVQSVSGYFCCLEGDSGKLVWDRSLHEELGFLSTYGGRTNFPLVFEDQVITSAVVIGWGDEPKWDFLARPAHRFMSFDKATGSLRWLAGTSISPDDTTYSTPTIAVLGGQAAMVFSSGDGGVWALQPRTGKPIWHYPISRRGANISPLVVGDTVFVSQSEENVVGNTMGIVVSLNGALTGDLTGKENWKQPEIMAGKSSPIMAGDKLVVIDDRAKLFVFDPETGEQLDQQKIGTVMRSTPLYADGKIYACTEGGRWWILRLDEGGNVEEVQRLRLDGEASNGSPIVSHGKIYLPTSEAIYCLGDPNVTPSADPLPPMPEETPVAENPEPALVQVEPWDAILSPGKTQAYSVRLYNARGQLLREVPAGEAKFSVDGLGSVDAAGVYTAPTGNNHNAALVVCEVAGLKGTARVRTVPPLPWSFDFNYGDKVPLTWVGGRIRYVVRDVDGEKVAVKRDVLPTPKDPQNKLGTRSYMYMGQTDLSNYTIQADFALPVSAETGKMGDIGLIDSRYQLTVRPADDNLHLYSWSSSENRAFTDAVFHPEPGKWYTFKLRVEQQPGKAIVMGKVWPRGEAEPDDWTLEMTDPSPNESGSPGLYGKSQEAEVYVDNISVVPNE